ncbi:hypothetical protein DICPUDRAFT_154198 [Dictyostelium purpureum]|uniref:HTTM-like domain-containing protein n=1 Tax=Dictyostelium purpureum TaxID=5786 RepID=F0ZQQ4_DICPU|nr:uncharacterized protein DICPUDRAFT_154198 [Dictyostelium purpureum]EGC33721.1 hypothetical protein DICPUDRAFT_154198 [Dictyostelium purpureum]|eukprot:XP_003289760.1 hypothetical protein DICPUDRAFT_154198 [Dictyostelium purpureum]
MNSNINNNSNNNSKFYERVRDGFSLDLRSLSFFRVLLSTYLLVDLATRSIYLNKHYTDYGTYPRSSSVSGERYSFHQFGGSTTFVLIIFITNAIINLSLMVGYRTRLSTILSFVFLASLQNRNHFVIDGSDDYCRTMLFFSIFLPLGEFFSVDSILSNKNKPKEKKKYLSGGTVSFLTQFIYIYVFTALFKAGEAWHETYDAVYYALNLIQFGHGMASFFLQFPSLMVFLTRVTLIFEYVGPFLLVSPFFNSTTRIISILGFVGMHIGFGLCLNLYLFVFIPMVVCTAFIPSDVWDFIERKYIATKEPIKIYYNSRLTAKNIQFKLFLDCFSTFFLFNHNVIINANSSKAQLDFNGQDSMDIERGNNEVYVENISVQYNGQTFTEERAIQFLVSKSFSLFLISNLSIKYFEKVLSYILNFNNNHDKSTKNNSNNSKNDENEIFNSFGNNPKKSLKRNIKNAFFVILMTYLFYYNLCIYETMLPDTSLEPSIAYHGFVKLLRVDQYWAMFAPEPPRRSVWIVSEGRFSNKSQIDVLTGETTNYKNIPSLFFNVGQRERNFLLAVSYVDHLRLEFGRYYCRKYNIYEKNENFGKLIDFRIYTLLKNTPPQGIDLETLDPNIKFQYISAHWFHQVSGVSIPIPYTLTLTETAPNTYTYSNNAFFPIDGRGN